MDEIIPADPVPKDPAADGPTVPTPAPTPEPPAAPPPRATPAAVYDALQAYDGETLRLINDLNEETQSLEDDWVKKNNSAKDSKRLLDGALDRIRRVITERKQGRGKPVQRTLFDPVVPALPPTPPLDSGGGAADPLEHVWRDFPLERLTNWNATDTDIAKLREGVRKKDAPHPLMTVGGLADYVANVGGDAAYERRLVDYKGIGTAAATRMDEALEQFWRWYNGGGREDFARERGLLPPLPAVTDATQPGGDGQGDGLEHVQHAGEPDPAGAGDPDDDRYEEPADAADEYSLAGPEDGGPETAEVP